ncbi:class I SAM-dependent DNA methyltransferase [Pseudactinotalea sp. HY160]|uniref:class I SAM-dependent DNA methyltransferase n=1 Tax=Pseudactinotalea sp. HY160 TaxID=2654490 RepID=UPI001D14C5E1|nr:class I SAM-dependent DNA methyltransferase [Pseudactinotalea sp. HY160]
MSDAITVGESWVSEHYFSAGGKGSFGARVLEARKFWDAEAKDGSPTVHSRFLAARGDLVSLLARLGDQHDDAADGASDGDHGAGRNHGTGAGNGEASDVVQRLNEALLDALGYDRPGLAIEQSGPLRRVGATGLGGAAPLAILAARRVGDVSELLDRHAPTLAEPYLEAEEPITSAAALLSRLFTGEEAPAFALVLAGPLALVTDAGRWAEGRYLAVDLQLVLDRNDQRRGGELDRALCCVSADGLAPDADGSIWWTGVLADSVAHTVGVSSDLRDGVRESIEILAGEVVRRRAARGLPPLPADQAQPLAIQTLRFLYRILFLLYAEASPELGVLPTGEGAYERGYSLDRLRDLALVELDDPRSREGTHLYESLATLFRLVDRGHPVGGGATGAADAASGEPVGIAGLEFQPLRADLFRPEATTLISEVGLGNHALQQVLERLLVSKRSTTADRGFISYADLGINQLGAVYEGLMSYTGFFATEDLYEVAPNGDASKGSWVVPLDRSHGIAAKDFVRVTDPLTNETKPVLHERGSFVFRLAGRERQQSASYYTPEVLTKFTVGQALAELLDQHGQRTSAREVLDLTVCEPALGSGAFAIEATRQLAEQYLARRQEELGERIDPDSYQRELQKAKTYIALHNVYGVDLNATAVELAEISLWLDTMGKGLAAPWFGLHLRRGNSLIGARRAVYRADQVSDKSWLKATPRPVPLAESLDAGIHHFLLPAQGWGAAVGAKEGKTLAPERVQELKAWQRSIRSKPTKKQVDRLQNVARRVERLWELALRRLEVADNEIRRSIDVWEAGDLPAGGRVTREQIEASLADPAGAFQRLKTIMDSWNALWFWPLTDRLTTPVVSADGAAGPGRIDPPSLEEWITALEGLAGTHLDEQATGRGKTWRGGDRTLASGNDWQELADAERVDLGFAGAKNPGAVRAAHPWLEVCDAVAAEQGFFHWELLFAPVFARRGGFDLQVGNPPWVRPRSDVAALLAEGDPWFQLAVKPTQAQVRERREATLALDGIRDLVIDGTADTVSTAEFVGDESNYPHLAGLQPDLYRCFMEQTWRHQSNAGVIGLIHLESHFTDEKADLLREGTYQRLRRHWQFINELMLFEIEHHKRYGVHVYGDAKSPEFLQAASVYHPDTVISSLVHDGSGPEPGIKDEAGAWDVRPHRNRIVRVDFDVMSSWHRLLEASDVPIGRTRMVYTVNLASAEVLEKIAAAPRIGELEPKFSRGWDESIDRKKGRFETSWGRMASWSDAILQGPHLHVAQPFFKSPNATMSSNLDWSEVDLKALAPDALPITSYKPAGNRAVYDASYTDWGENGEHDPARDHYRLAWRCMVANTGERTLIPAIIPPGAAHVDGLYSLGGVDPVQTVVIAALMSSLVADFSIRSVPKSTIRAGTASRLPMPHFGTRVSAVILRTLRLNCLTDAYADLWQSVWDELKPADPSQLHPFTLDSWTGSLDYPGRPDLGDIGPEWTPATPLRRDSDRRQALLEIDALVALSLGITADELVTIYRTQFPVLYGYDHGKYLYDANGRLVPTSIQQLWRKQGDDLSAEQRTATHPGSDIDYTYDLPFRHLDREADLRRAMAAFESGFGDVSTAGLTPESRPQGTENNIVRSP